MAQIEFNYNQNLTIIQANLNDKFKDVINKYIQKTSLAPNKVFFLANGKQINTEETVENIMNDINKENKHLKVLVQIIEDENNKTKIIEQSKEIICPICNEPCRFKFDDYKLQLFDCINKHPINKMTMKIKDFPKTQNINISKIICGKCKIKNMGISPNKEFYKCLTCDMNICLLCRNNHDLNHNLIKYTKRNFICQKHNESFIKYCHQCNMNICYLCDEEHTGHKTIFLGLNQILKKQKTRY